MNFSWKAFGWLIVAGFIAGIWFCRTLYMAVKLNKRDKEKSKIAKAEAEKTKANAEAEKAKAKAEEAEANAKRAKR